MTNLKPQGFIIMIIIIVIGTLIYTSPTWYKDLTKTINENKAEEIELDKEEQEFFLQKRKTEDSLTKIDLKKKKLNIKKSQDSLERLYNYYYFFIDEALVENGNIETDNFLILKKYNRKDSCNRFIIYKKFDVLTLITLDRHGTAKVSARNLKHKGNWFKVNKYILPCKFNRVNSFKENEKINIQELVTLMKDFKSEHLIKQ